MLLADEKSCTSPTAPIAHVWIDEDVPHCGDFEYTLVHLDIGYDPSREDHRINPCLLDIVLDIVSSHNLKRPLIRSSHVDLGKEGG